MSSEHEKKLKQERRLLVQRTSDLHQARIGASQVAHIVAPGDKNDGKPYSEKVQAAGIYLPESEARRLAAAGSVVIVKDIHGQETIKEAV